MRTILYNNAWTNPGSCGRKYSTTGRTIRIKISVLTCFHQFISEIIMNMRAVKLGDGIVQYVQTPDEKKVELLWKYLEKLAETDEFAAKLVAEFEAYLEKLKQHNFEIG